METNIYDGNLSIKIFLQKCRQHRFLFLFTTIVASALGLYFSLTSLSFNTFTGKIDYILTDDILIADNDYVYSFSAMEIELNTIDNIFNNMKSDSKSDELIIAENFIESETSSVVSNTIKYEKNDQEYLQVIFVNNNYEELKEMMSYAHSQLKVSLIDHSIKKMRLKSNNLQKKIENLTNNEMLFIDNTIDNHKKLFNISYNKEIEDIENLIKISNIVDIDINNISNTLTMPGAISSFFNVIGESSFSSRNKKYSYFEGKKILNEKLSNLKKYEPDEKILKDPIYIGLLGDRYKIKKQIKDLDKEISQINSDIITVRRMNLLPSNYFSIQIVNPDKIVILIIYILVSAVLGIILTFFIILMREMIKISKSLT